jgi:hypothetical protein
MRDETVVAAADSAISDPSNVEDLVDSSFVIGSFHFWNNTIPHLASSGVTGAKTVSLWKLTAGVWVAVYDGSGVAVQLTATNPQEAILSEGTYGVSTSDTGVVVTIQMP